MPLRLPVPLSDPSCYAPVMDYLKNMAEDVEQDGNDYCVLLLLTDGGIAGITLDLFKKYCQLMSAVWASADIVLQVCGIEFDSQRDSAG